jgi:hypothetical protein
MQRIPARHAETCRASQTTDAERVMPRAQVQAMRAGIRESKPVMRLPLMQ